MSLIRFGLELTDLTIVTTGSTYKIVNEEVVVVNKTSGSATAISLPAVASNLSRGRVIWIKDGKGDAGTNNITISDPASNNIDGASSLVISSNYGHSCLMWNGTQWNVIG